MPEIKHVMYSKELSHDFRTEDAILKFLPYTPEILILGTFNPNTPKTNYADFFYGRNYLWPALENLFHYNEVKLLTTRMPKRGKPKNELNPSLTRILEICENLKLTFADLILSVLHNDNPDYQILDNDNVCYSNTTFNLIQDDKKDQISGLSQLDKLDQVNWNISNIINYLIDNPQIKTIYFTRQPKGIWKDKWEKVKEDKRLENRSFTNIFTPSGQGKPVLNSMSRLLQHWVHNDKEGFGRFDNNWLKSKGVTIHNF